MPEIVRTIDPVRLGDRLRMARARCSLTQEQAAWETGISQRELSNIECGIYTPRLRTFLALCRLYRVSPEELAAEASREEVSP